MISFFPTLHVYGFQKIVKFLCCFIVWIRDFIKNLRYLKYKISTKFHHLLSCFFFSIFGILISISPIQICPKIMEFFVVFIGRLRDFTKDFWKILKVLLKKYWYVNFFFRNSAIYYLFCYFFIIFDILFSISPICTYQQILQIFMFLYFMDYRFYQRILENHGIFF